MRRFLLLTILALAAGFDVAAAGPSWQSAPSLPDPLKESGVFSLGSHIYVTGGRTTGNAITDVFQYLDTSLGTWASLGALPEPRAGHAAVWIQGRFYVAGGTTPIETDDGKVYDPAGPAWSAIAPMPSPNAGMGGCTDGTRMYLFGGGYLGAARDSAHAYEPATNQWTVLPNMPRARKSPACVFLNGRIYVIGGHTATSGVNDALAAVDVFHLATGTWSSAPDLPVAATAAAAVALGGRVYVLGGADGTPSYGKIDGVFSHRPGDPRWRVEPSLPVGVVGLAAAVVGDSALYAMGGEPTDEFDITAAVHRFTVHEPDIVSVLDVPNDEGGRLTLRWLASNLDRWPAGPIGRYEVWREVPAGMALAAVRGGARLVAAGQRTPAGDAPVFRATTAGQEVIYWEYVGAQPARGFPAYSYTVPTLFDSLPGSSPKTRVMVLALDESSGDHWASAPDSGCSKDNLAPPAPLALAGDFVPGALSLRWSASSAGDVAGYRIYRGKKPAFEPSPASLVAFATDTSHVDPVNEPHYYRVAAVDVHGNEGPASDPQPVALAVGPFASAGLALAPPAPNPAMRATVVRFSLASSEGVRLAVYDAAGREVRLLVHGTLAAGRHEVAFDLRDAAGKALDAGVYFVSLRSGGMVRHSRLAVVR